ncbi:MAG: diguanylate cyclase [Magnetococcales bacterium]|nr:diguanylate cyclase [Magnetococcales bacterium]
MFNPDFSAIKKYFSPVAIPASRTGLGIQFFLLIFVITFLSLGSIDRVRQSLQLTEKISGLRVPTSQYSLSMVNGVNGALAALRGWMLIGEEHFKDNRAHIWKEQIHGPLKSMKNISTQWTDPNNLAILKQIEKLIPDFEKIQQDIEDIAHTNNNVPAMQLLVDQAIPLAEIMSQNIHLMIKHENQLPATPGRKTLLGIMANVNGSIGMFLEKLRDYLISGDSKSKSEFYKYWNACREWFSKLNANRHLLTSEQNRSYEALDLAHANFLPFPEKLIKMREKADWNIALHLLRTKAAPMGKRLVMLLQEMAHSQKQQLNDDVVSITRMNRLLSFMLWGLFLGGIILAFVLTRYISKEKIRQMELELEKEHVDILSGCSGLRETCDVALRRLCKDHGAVIGLLYYQDKSTNKLHLGGLYGKEASKVESTIVSGDGILGQTFINKTVNNIDYAPTGEIINAGSLPIMPKQLLTFPIMYNSEVIGVVQFACLIKQKTSEIDSIIRKLQTTGRFIHDAILVEKVSRQLELLDQRIITSSTDRDGVITMVSSAFADISGYSKEEMIGRNHRLVRHPDMDATMFKTLWKDISSGKEWHGEIKNLKKDGGHYWVDAWISPDYDLFGNITGFTAVRSDITDKKKIEELSITDSLTGLFNRRHFDSLFQHQLDVARRDRKAMAFAIMDIDFFKLYNDNYGHQKGDKTLQQVAGALNKCAKRPQDYAFRLGGEEFGILFVADDIKGTICFGKSINTAISKLQIPHAYSKVSQFVSISIGVIFIPHNSSLDVTALYKYADQQLYKAKESGRNQVACLEIAEGML